MKSLIIASSITVSVLVSLVATAAAFAQTPAAPAETAAPAASPAAPPTSPPAAAKPAKPRLSSDEKRARSKQCSRQATDKNLHGNERRAFRSACIKRDGTPA